MPQTKVTGPDGRTYTVTHPEGATKEEIIAYAQRSSAGIPSRSGAAPVDVNLGRGQQIASDVGQGAIRGLAGIGDLGVGAYNTLAAGGGKTGIQTPMFPQIPGNTTQALQSVGAIDDRPRNLPGLIGEFGALAPITGTMGAAATGTRVIPQIAREALSSTLAATGAWGANQMAPGVPGAEFVGALTPTGIRAAGAAATRGTLRGADPTEIRANLMAPDTVGGPTTVAAAAQMPRMQALEAAVSSAPGGVTPFRRTGLAAAEAMRGRLERLTRGASDDIVRGGNIIRRGLFGDQGFVERFKGTRAQLYERFDQMVGPNTMTIIPNTYQLTAQLNRNMPRAPMTSERLRDQGLLGDLDALTTDMTNNLGAVPYDAVKQMRTRIGDKLADPDLIGSIERKHLSQAYEALTKDMEAVARATGPKAEMALMRANRFNREGTKQIEDFYEGLNSKVSGEEVWNAVIGDAPRGASRLNAIRKGLRPQEWAEVQRTVITRMGQPHPSAAAVGAVPFSPQVFLTRYEQMQRQSGTMQAMFGTGQYRRDLDTVAEYASQLRRTGQVLANPSGTAARGLTASAFFAGTGAVGGGLLGTILGGPPGAAMGAAKGIALGLAAGIPTTRAIAGLFTNQKFIHWLAESTRISPARMPGHISRLILLANDDPELLEVVPSLLEQAEAAQGPQPGALMGLLDEIRRNPILSQVDPRTVVGALAGSPVPTGSLAYGLGGGIANQALGVSQVMRDPRAIWEQSQGAGQAIAADPRGVATGLLSDVWQRARSGPQGLGEVIGENLGLPRRAPKGLLELDVYHGTPHVFEPEPEAPHGKFKLGAVGTGEGAQVYGHGIYVAENPNTANYYRKNLSDWQPEGVELPPRKGYPLHPEERAMQAMRVALDDVPSGKPAFDAAYALARRNIRREINEYANAIPGVPTEKGNAVMQSLEEALQTLNDWQLKDVTFKRGGAVYKADLPDEVIPKMMHWEKRLEEQPDVLASMRAAFQSGLQEKYGPGMGDAYTFDDYIRGRAGGRPEDWTAIPAGRIPAGQAYKFLAAGLGGDPALASRKLAEQGVPGVKYWDQQSRMEGKGTRNFVLFEPELAKIIGRE